MSTDGADHFSLRDSESTALAGKGLGEQLNKLSDCGKVFQEKATGASADNRFELRRALGLVCEGDAFMVSASNLKSLCIKGLRINRKPLCSMAAPSGFEPKTYRLGGGCSIQLSYGARGVLFIPDCPFYSKPFPGEFI